MRKPGAYDFCDAALMAWRSIPFFALAPGWVE
jgi:hypothetical protein